MGLLNFFRKPKWKNSKSNVRLAAIEDMSVDDLETLVEIIRKDSDQQVRLAALAKIDDQKRIESLLQEELPEAVIGPVKEKLAEIYTDLIICEPEKCVPDELLVQITNQNLLARIAVEAAAVDLRCQAVAAINDPVILGKILKQHCGKKPALAAVKKISDADMLAELADKAVNKSARAMAAKKISAKTVEENDKAEADSVQQPIVEEQTAPDQDEKEDRQQLINAELIKAKQEICDQIESLCNEKMAEEAESRFADIEKKWPADSGDDEELLNIQKRYEEFCNRFRTTLDKFKDEKQTEKDVTAACIQIEQFLQNDNIGKATALLNKNIQELESKVWQWLDTDALTARFAVCRKKLEDKKEELADIARVAKEKLQAITDICEEMEKLTDSSDRYTAEKRVKKLSASWRKLSKNAENQYDEFAARFQSASDDFWKRQKQFYKEQEWQRWNNKIKKEELCTIVESLKEEDDLQQVSAKLKECQSAWKESGPVSKKDSDTLWQRFKSACDENYERCRSYYAELDEKRQERLVIKEELCVKAEEHVASTEWKEAAEILKGLQKEWKEAGPGPRKKDEALYKRFRKACDQFFDRRSAFFAENDAEYKENLQAKEKLCQQVEELLREPKREHEKLIRELQKKWKAIGPVPRENNQEIWQRFRGTCDVYYGWLDEKRQENLQQKIALCEQVEALLPGAENELDGEEAIWKIVELQKQWKAIGPVPRKEADDLWKRFRNQCDNFFTARKEQIQEEENKKQENKSRKEELLQRAGEVIQQQNEEEINDQLQALQEEWKQIGAAPKEQEQLLEDEFQALSNAFFQEKQHGFQENNEVLDETLKKKEELCFQLERLAGNEHEFGNEDKEGSLDLIEQFKIAREANFLLAGKTENVQKKKEEVRRIQQEWKDMGSTYREHEQRLWKRYRKALELFFTDRSS